MAPSLKLRPLVPVGQGSRGLVFKHIVARRGKDVLVPVGQRLNGPYKSAYFPPSLGKNGHVIQTDSYFKSGHSSSAGIDQN